MLIAATAVQVGTGLFATDDIFTEGPLYDYASAEFARVANWIHHRLHWLILGGLGVHLTAHAVYGFVLRDRTALAMFTGRKPNREHLPSDAELLVAGGGDPRSLPCGRAARGQRLRARR